jgi:hypothetical protein
MTLRSYDQLCNISFSRMHPLPYAPRYAQRKCPVPALLQARRIPACALVVSLASAHQRQMLEMLEQSKRRSEASYDIMVSTPRRYVQKNREYKTDIRR